MGAPDETTVEKQMIRILIEMDFPGGVADLSKEEAALIVHQVAHDVQHCTPSWKSWRGKNARPLFVMGRQIGRVTTTWKESKKDKTDA